MSYALNFEQTTRGVYAAWRLFLRDPRAAKLFENSYEGAVRSYWAAAVILPVYVAIVAMEYAIPVGGYANFGKLAGEAGFFNAAVAEVIVYALCWFVAWPLVIDRIAPMLGCDANFFRYVSAYNWMHMVYVAIGLLYWTLIMAGLVDPANGLAVTVSLLTLLWIYHWFVVRHTLEVNGAVATLLVASEFMSVTMLKGMVLTAAL